MPPNEKCLASKTRRRLAYAILHRAARGRAAQPPLRNGQQRSAIFRNPGCAAWKLWRTPFPDFHSEQNPRYGISAAGKFVSCVAFTNATRALRPCIAAQAMPWRFPACAICAATWPRKTATSDPVRANMSAAADVVRHPSVDVAVPRRKARRFTSSRHRSHQRFPFMAIMVPNRRLFTPDAERCYRTDIRF